VGWNQTFVASAEGLGSSGGGYSILFPRPYWQATALPGSMFRGVPDVALTASSYEVPYLISDSWTAADGFGQTPFPEEIDAIGGTSASTPSFAGILALVNQAINAENPGLGNVGPVLYSLYQSAPSAFHDITMGSNIVPCTTGSESCPTTGMTEYGYECGPGYDLVTGLGSVNAAALVAAWTSLAPTSTALAVSGAGADGGAEGTPLTLTATVGSNVSTHPITGKVTFYFETLSPGTPPTPDIGYSLGEVAVTDDVTDAGKSGATATLTAPAPVGFAGTSSQIVAFYGGDQNFLSSYSTASSVTTATTFAVTPATAMIQPNAEMTFTATGGVPPVLWRITADDTCSANGYPCSAIKTLSPTSVTFQAGPNPGSVTLEGVDSDYAEATATITVAGSPVDAGRLNAPDAGMKHHIPDAAVDTGVIGFDAGVDSGVDSGTDAGTGDTGATQDTGTKKVPPSDDSGSPVEDSGTGSKEDASASAKSTGGCTVAPESSPDLGLLGLPLVLVPRRRRRTR
jgi:subtilase family serine protease